MPKPRPFLSRPVGRASRKAFPLALAALLAGCVSSERTAPVGRDSPSAPKGTATPRVSTAPSFTSPDARQCAADLQQAGVRFTPLPNQEFGGGCRAIDSVKLLDIGTPTTNLGAMTCPLARNFAAWARHAVQPAAQKIFGSQVARIETFGTYSCRNIYGGRSGRLSQHAYANAIDVSGFVLANGRRIMLDGGWAGDAASQEFLRTLHKSACRRFGTVLGPDYNAAHYNHFHFDMSGNGYCR